MKTPWSLVFLAHGFFDISFESLSKMQRIPGGGSCLLLFGIFQVFQWQPDFNPTSPTSQTNAQVWVRNSGLSYECWDPNIIFSIAYRIDLRLQVYRATRSGTYGYYVRVLVDLDVVDNLPSSITFERANYGFMVNIALENLLKRCTKCGYLSHKVTMCHRIIMDIIL